VCNCPRSFVLGCLSPHENHTGIAGIDQRVKGASEILERYSLCDRPYLATKIL
jgi:hypothetical protein